MKKIFIRDRKGHTETLREGHEKKEAEVRVRLPQTRKWEEPPSWW